MSSDFREINHLLNYKANFLDRGGNRGEFFRKKPTFWTDEATDACFQNNPTQQDKDNVLRVAVSTFVFRIE